MTAKTTKTFFWISTVFIFLFEGVMPALTYQTELAKNSMRHLGYPEYFDKMLVVFRLFGVCALIIPKIPNRIKEWAYAGFTFEFLSALISLMVTDGFGVNLLFPIVALSILACSYVCHHRSLQIKPI